MKIVYTGTYMYMSWIYQYILVYTIIHTLSQDFEVDIVMLLCQMHPSLLSNRRSMRDILLHAQRMKSFCQA